MKLNKKTLEEWFVRYGATDQPEGAMFKQLKKDRGLENC